MRPERYARRPAWTARFMAVAMAAASPASAMAVFIRIASAPSSIASAASLGTPTPASTMIVASGSCSRMIRRFDGFCTPMPEPIGAASGITAEQPASRSFLAIIRSSLKYGRTINPSSTRIFAAASVCSLSGSSVTGSPMTSSLIHSVSSASRASLAVRIAWSAS